MDRRIRYQDLEENLGIAENTNAAFAMAKGEFVGLLDHDDLLAPNALYEVAMALEQHPQADVIWYENLFALLRDLEKQVRDGDTVLVKASHFMHFEKIVDALAAEAE